MDKIENYQVTSIIGSGSFSTCYKVKHKESLKEFVWKAVNCVSLTENNIQLLISEINLHVQLKHPNIVTYYNHIMHHKSSTLYIVLECCNGGDLESIIKNCVATTQHLNELFIWRILYQICSALNICHSRALPVLHRNIKPANILLDTECNVKLGDFGFVSLLANKRNFTHNNTASKSTLYMSPELIDGSEKYNKHSEIWALGCLLYEISTLTPPFVANDIQDLCFKIKTGDFNKIPNKYTDDLQQLISLMLSTNSENRPSIHMILQHPTLLSKGNKYFKSIYAKATTPPTTNGSNSSSSYNAVPLEYIKINEDLQIRTENIRNRETAIQLKESKLQEIERNLIKRENKIARMERLANEKLTRANLYLKRSKDYRHPLRLKRQLPPTEVMDTSCSADPGDNSILPTSTKIDEQTIAKPKEFIRSERNVHFNAQRVFESNKTDEVFIKEYHFFTEDHKNAEQTTKKHGGFGFLKTLNQKISQGTKSSNASSILSSGNRAISWTKENKKCAFTLLKMMKNADYDKENLHTKITHTQM